MATVVDSPKSNCIACLHYRVGCVSPINSLEAVEVSTGEVGRMLGGEEDSVLLHSLVYLGEEGGVGGEREGKREEAKEQGWKLTAMCAVVYLSVNTAL